jgi:hypothetical protein
MCCKDHSCPGFVCASLKYDKPYINLLNIHKLEEGKEKRRYGERKRERRRIRLIHYLKKTNF